jgi:Dienelactone hydrolase and related enzymes
MEDANADLTFIVYPGAKHAFTVPEADAHAKEFGIPLGYNAEADQKSWAETQSFLKKTFGEDKGT